MSIHIWVINKLNGQFIRGSYKHGYRIDIWVISKLNEQFIKGLNTEIKFSKNKIVNGKNSLFVIGPFRTFHFICLNIAFGQDIFVWCDNHSTFN